MLQSGSRLNILGCRNEGLVLQMRKVSNTHTIPACVRLLTVRYAARGEELLSKVRVVSAGYRHWSPAFQYLNNPIPECSRWLQ